MVTTLGKLLNRRKGNLPPIYRDVTFPADSANIKIQSIRAKMGSAQTLTNRSFFLSTLQGLSAHRRLSSIPGPTH